jgi:DNA invertase Pin-like site-specific DNA recombinase
MSEVLAVLRISTKQQDLDNQRKEVSDYCIMKGYDIFDIIEIKKSAYKKVPKEILELVEKIEKEEYKNIKKLIFADVDRFTRNIKNGMDILSRLQKCNVIIEFVRENIDYTTPIGMKLLKYKMVDAEYESDMISQRVSNSLICKKFMKYHIGGVKFGKKIINKKLVNNEEEQYIIKIIKMFNRPSIKIGEVMEEIENYHINYKTESLEEEYYVIYNGYRLNGSESISMFTYTELSQLLNEYDIKKRGHKWNGLMVKRICGSRRVTKQNYLLNTMSI